MQQSTETGAPGKSPWKATVQTHLPPAPAPARAPRQRRAPAQVATTTPPSGLTSIQGGGQFKYDEDATPSANFNAFIRSGKLGLVGIDESAQLRFWREGWWQLPTDDEARGMVQKFLLAYAPDHHEVQVIKGCVNLARLFFANEPTHRLASPEKHRILGFKNAYLKIHEDGRLEVLAPAPEHGVTFIINADIPTPVGEFHTPRPRAQGLFHRYLNTSLPDLAVQAIIQEQAALTLLPGPHHKGFWWWGMGRNGKGVMFSLLESVHCRPKVLNMSKMGGDFGLSSILGASVLLSSEVPLGKWAEEIWKALVAGDSLDVALKHRDSVTYKNRAVHLISSNAAPMICDLSFGVRSRLCVVEWKATIPEEERVEHLDRLILETDNEAFVDWLLLGVQKIAARGGKFLPRTEWPAAVIASNEELSLNGNSLAHWILENKVAFDPKGQRWVGKDDAYKHYTDWCETAGMDPITTSGKFWAAMWRIPEFRDAKAMSQGARDNSLGNVGRPYMVPMSVAGLRHRPAPGRRTAAFEMVPMGTPMTDEEAKGIFGE